MDEAEVELMAADDLGLMLEEYQMLKEFLRLFDRRIYTNTVIGLFNDVDNIKTRALRGEGEEEWT